jgi:cytochrome c oxidase assembly protein subunit 15
VAPPPSAGRLLHRLTWLCCIAVVLTMLAGGFVAGTHAGFDYNTFPLMDGRLMPQGYAALEPFVRNLTENIAAVQFDHRVLATLTALLATAVVIAGLSTRAPRGTRIALVALLVATATQYVLGVATLIHVVPVALAAMHQAVAVLLLTAVIVVLHTTRAAPSGWLVLR